MYFFSGPFWNTICLSMCHLFGRETLCKSLLFHLPWLLPTSGSLLLNIPNKLKSHLISWMTLRCVDSGLPQKLLRQPHARASRGGTRNLQLFNKLLLFCHSVLIGLQDSWKNFRWRSLREAYSLRESGLWISLMIQVLYIWPNRQTSRHLDHAPLQDHISRMQSSRSWDFALNS